jgi:ectoine hydroxylase-related dioxygenase (phytanoyl-CoA dioxygenase family)
MGALTPSEVREYNESGFLVTRLQLGPERLHSLHEAVEHVIAANPEVRPERLVNVHTPGRNPQGLVGDARFLELAKDPDILDVVSEVIGPDIILWGFQLFCKPRGDGMAVPWHQDGYYWPIRPLANCTAWLALDDCSVANGCLRVIAGSHRDRRVFEHERDDNEELVLNLKVVEAELDEGRAVDIELRAGQLALLDVYMIHGSNPNHSPNRRAAAAIRYMPGTSYIDPNLFSPRPLWLLRGEDRTGRNDFGIHHDRECLRTAASTSR